MQFIFYIRDTLRIFFSSVPYSNGPLQNDRSEIFDHLTDVVETVDLNQMKKIYIVFFYLTSIFLFNYLLEEMS